MVGGCGVVGDVLRSESNHFAHPEIRLCHDHTLTFGSFKYPDSYFWDTPEILNVNVIAIFGTALAPEVHVGGHVFDDVVIEVVGAEFVWEGSRHHRPPVAVRDPSVFHRFTQCNSGFRFWR